MKKLIIICLFVLTGCVAQGIVASTPGMVMMQYVDITNEVEALKMAEAECAKHEKHAVLLFIGGMGQRSHECKD